MVERRRARAADPRVGWYVTAGVFALAVAFGIFVLPRLQLGLEGKPAPDFSLPVLHGGEPGARVRLADQKGKLVLLDFWASWCAPCRQQTSVLQAVQARYPGNDLVVLGINVSESPEAARAYLEAVKPPWVVVADNEGETSATYEARTLPTVVAIDRSGKVFAIRRRFVPERELWAMIQAMD